MISLEGATQIVLVDCHCPLCDYSARKSVEQRAQQDEERANMLEVQVEEARQIAEEADRKYEEVSICPMHARDSFGAPSH